MIKYLVTIDNPVARAIVTGERVLLNVLEGGCTLPISTNSKVKENDDEWVSNLETTNISEVTLRIECRVFD
jgi:porphobilinogen deaminase